MYFHEAYEKMKQGYLFKFNDIKYRIWTETSSIGSLKMLENCELQYYSTYSKAWKFAHDDFFNINMFIKPDWEIGEIYDGKD